MNKRAVVSFSNSRGNYLNRLARLGESFKGKFAGDFLGYIGEGSIGAPLHIDNPYAFKIYAIEKAIESGYSQILWLDSSVYAVADVQPVFDEIERNGYIMQDAGAYVGEWTNDRVLDYFNLSRDEAMNMKCYGNAGFLGLDFTNPIAIEFFKQWHDAMLFGMFKGEWTNENGSESLDARCKGSRHDLSCGSIIANRLGMTYKKGDEWLQYGAPEDELINDTIIFKAQG